METEITNQNANRNEMKLQKLNGSELKLQNEDKDFTGEQFCWWLMIVFMLQCDLIQRRSKRRKLRTFGLGNFWYYSRSSIA